MVFPVGKANHLSPKATVQELHHTAVQRQHVMISSLAATGIQLLEQKLKSSEEEVGQQRQFSKSA
jgi:hypothetical protein